MDNDSIHTLLVEQERAETRRIHRLLAQISSVRFTWEHVEKLSVATELLRDEHFDLVLLDLCLPDCQGLETFSRLYPHAVCLPIVILTDVEDESLALQAVQAGAQDYFVKGQIDGKFLAQALRQAIERKRVETALRVKIRELTLVAYQLEQAVRIGHQLNNSLATVMLSIEVLLAQIPREDLRHTDLQVVHAEISRMGRLVANLLQFSNLRLPQNSKAAGKEDLASSPGLIQYLHGHNIVPVQDELTYFFQTMRDETAGYVLKGDAANELVAMIYRVSQESILIPHTLGPRLLDDSKEEMQTGERHSEPPLSAPEQEVVRLVAQGCTNKDVAKQLSLSVRTVERYRASIMNKLSLQNRAELVAYAVRQDLLGGMAKSQHGRVDDSENAYQLPGQI
jgi:DNA-binding NarL/FixJ family response regulator